MPSAGLKGSRFLLKVSVSDFSIKVEGCRRELKASQGKTLLETLLDEDFEIAHSCGGMGTCGTCRVVVTSEVDKLPPRNEVESEMAEDRGFHPSERLACQLEISSSLTIKVPGVFFGGSESTS